MSFKVHVKDHPRGTLLHPAWMRKAAHFRTVAQYKSLLLIVVNDAVNGGREAALIEQDATDEALSNPD